VVQASGGLGGYAGGLKKKRDLLILENVIIVGGKIDLKKFGWKI